MPLGRPHTDGFLERRFASEIGRIILRLRRIGLRPDRVVAPVVAAVELVVRVDPTRQDHHLVLRQPLGVILFLVDGVSGIAQDLHQDAVVGSQALGRKRGAVPGMKCGSLRVTNVSLP